MRLFTKQLRQNALYAGALAAASTMPTATLAQSSAEESAPATEASAVVIEEITVTARRRAENLQDVPIAVTALSADQLETLNVRSLEDVTAFAPNIKINAGRATSGTVNAYIRGIGQNDPLWGFEPGVGIYLDDVFLARPQTALLDVYDVERVEVLRGPQGTLYGKNTIAGAIKYVTRDIVADPTLTVSATAGSFNQREAKISGSAPLIEDRLYVGAAVAYLRRDGYGEIVDDGAPRLYNRVGQDVSDKDTLAARVNATMVWGDSSRLKVMADLVEDNANATGGQRLSEFAGNGVLDDRYDQRTDMPVDRDYFQVKGASATYTQELSDSLGLKVIGAYREGRGRQFIDFDELNANLFQVPAEYSDRQGSGEVQLSFETERVTGVGGVFYFDGTACGSFDASLGGALASLTQGCVDTQSVAAYFDTTWKLSSKVNLNLGARWNQDDKEASVFVAQYAGALAPDSTLFDRNAVPPGFLLLAVQSDYTNDRKFSNVSPRIGLDVQLADRVMGYVSYSRGFKSGGFDMRGNEAANPDTRRGYDAETADNFEIGIKSTLLDGRLTLNGTVFYTPYEDMQVTSQQFQIVNGNPTNVTAVLNAGEQLNKGVELESVWRPVDALTLSLNVGYLEAEFEEFLAPCGAACPGEFSKLVDISNLHTPINSPEWTAFLGGVYEWPLASGALTAHAGFQHRAKTKVANTTPSVTDQDAYQILDLGVAYTQGNWRFALDGKNILDEEYRVAGYDFGPISQIGFYGPPRTVAATATFRY